MKIFSLLFPPSSTSSAFSSSAWPLVLLLTFVIVPFLVLCVRGLLSSRPSHTRRPLGFSCLYVGRVWHVRFLPTLHKFAYGLFYTYLDLGKDLKRAGRGVYPSDEAGQGANDGFGRAAQVTTQTKPARRVQRPTGPLQNPRRVCSHVMPFLYGQRRRYRGVRASFVGPYPLLPPVRLPPSDLPGYVAVGFFLHPRLPCLPTGLRPLP